MTADPKGDPGDLDLRYLRVRRGARTLRRYWIRDGETVRLPDDETWPAALARLNRAADATGRGGPAEGSVRWLIAKYRDSKAFRSLAPGSKAIYDRWLRFFDDTWGDLPPRAITRGMAVDLVESRDGQPSVQGHIRAVGLRLMDLALYHEKVAVNAFADLRVEAGAPRDQVWTPAQIRAWLKACHGHRHGFPMWAYFQLLRYTAQRPVDVAAMTLEQWREETVPVQELVAGRWVTRTERRGAIAVRQQKTGTLVDVPAHPALFHVLRAIRARLPAVAHLAAEDPAAARAAGRRPRARPAGTPLVFQPDGRPWSRDHLTRMFGEICAAAGIADRQARDLRRTGIVELFRAGATEKQVSDVSGHTIERSRRILETYAPRDPESARAGMRKWADARKRRVAPAGAAPPPAPAVATRPTSLPAAMRAPETGEVEDPGPPLPFNEFRRKRT